MKRNLLTAALCLTVLTLGGVAVAQDPFAMMAPGEEHKQFKPFVGDWKAEIKSWMAPGADPMVVEGVSTYEIVLDGRYLKQTIEANMMGQPFTGMGLTGYDRYGKVYQMVWMDSMGTAMSVSESSSLEEMVADIRNPMTGDPVKTRMVTKIVNDDKHVFSMYAAGPDGKEMKTAEITYTRK